MIRLTLAAVAALAVTSAQAGVCFDKNTFQRLRPAVLVDQFTGRIKTEDDSNRILHVATDRNGNWIVWYTIEDVMVCPLAAGTGWTPQGDIPRDEIN